ncbi:cupin domain-containing protein [Phaeobacter sp. QD34_3]|uniref:cupin domain-containing protein n=1 Tax=unclassified Phaeobacter TaxID=2621772 RepID=UPI00237FCE01|nr:MULTISPECIES: cupin domain-containing protein [unclassified Phaeobacter]MDE4133283.1 cupin domain-containing protein [Phaeobacter sp. QD34_3]MDE4136930.1 cupin domain-containing protein [Phaeobacter sp. QD34_24]
MRINADFTKRVAVHFDDTPWVPSPAAGVERKMLDRIGSEVARATTIVRFAPGSSFTAHTHDGGEEYFVLDGVFQDEDGDFPVGSYVRNPPTSRHTPAARDGATILVKLHQFDPEDRQLVQIDTTKAGEEPLHLFRDAREEVRLLTWGPGEEVSLDAPGGAEVFVLEGAYRESGEDFARWDWLRLPPGGTFEATAGPDGARIWMKTGHLAEMLNI